MKKFAVSVLVLLLAGCANRSAAPDRPAILEDNASLMSEPTPPEWTTGAVWHFVQSGRNGAVEREFTVRVTGRPEQTCSAGDWRALELVEDSLPCANVPLKQAFSVAGRLLTIDLSGWCDVGEIQGALSGDSFAGKTTGGLLFGAKFVPQKVTGRRVR